MGNNLFGANISGKLARALGRKLLLCVLTKTTSAGHDPTNPTGGTQLTPVTTLGRGFIEDFSASQINGTTIQKGDKTVSVLGDTLAGGRVVPEVDDQITIEGKLRTIVGIKRDPDAALYMCHCRG